MVNAIVVNSLLQFALEKSANKFKYDDFYSYLTQNQHLISDHDDIQAQIKSSQGLFRLIEQHRDKMIEITKKVSYSMNY